MRDRRLLVLVAVAAVLAGCGGGGSAAPSFPKVGAAKTYTLAQFKPGGPMRAGTPTTVSFVIKQPNGQPLTHYRRGAGPHTGVHLIIVRHDLSTLVHLHPPVSANGVASVPLTLSEPGPYRVVIDAYPDDAAQPNFQLFSTIHVQGAYQPKPLPTYSSTQVVDGFHITLHGRPKLHAIEAGDLVATVTDPQGRPATFTPWFGALAHAIFFRRGSLDYFHTHICAPGATGCTSVLGGAKVTGTSSTPGKLTIGVLVPAPGTWRLFLQCKVNGRVMTAPFTLAVQ